MKILVYYSESNLKPVGGPAGYLFNLMTAINKLNEKEISFNLLPKSTGIKENVRQKIKKNGNKFLKSIIIFYRSYRNAKAIAEILYRTKKPSIDLNQYDILHFHTTKDFFLIRDALKEFKGKTVITSHSPQPLSGEFISQLGSFWRFIFGKKLKNLIEMDRYAFENADYILFPCEEADEPYIHEWPEYAQIKERKRSVYKYVLTGSNPAKVLTDRKTVRNKLGIPEDAFVISYVGRHNQIKGYDRLKEIGQIFLEKYPNSYVLVAGIESPIKGLNHPHWIEIGWTNEPHSYVNSSDVFLLPNRETYFDLVMLEVMSVGKISLISNTGGNKYFHKFPEAGILYFDNIANAVEKLEVIHQMKKDEINEKEAINRKIFEENFTTDIFAQNYIEFYRSLGAVEK